MEHLHISSTRMPCQIWGGHDKTTRQQAHGGEAYLGVTVSQKGSLLCSFCTCHETEHHGRENMCQRLIISGRQRRGRKDDPGKGKSLKDLRWWPTSSNEATEPFKNNSTSWGWSLEYTGSSHTITRLSFSHRLCKRTVKICFDIHMSYQKWMSFLPGGVRAWLLLTR